MEFRHETTNEGFRVGELRVTSKSEASISTPGCILYTRGGAVPHLLPEVNKTIDKMPQAVHITLPTVIEQPGCEVIVEVEGGLPEFLRLEDYITYLSVQDPVQNVPDGYNEEKTVSVWSPSGRKRVDIQDFISFCKVFKVNMVECLCDTAHSCQSAKRTRKSVDRTLKYLDEFLKAKQNDNDLTDVVVLGVIQGSDSEKERRRSAQETAKRAVDGFVIEGFKPEQDYKDLLHKTTLELPVDKPRMIHNMSTIDGVLEAVEAGVDLFDSSFPYEVTQRGCALRIPTHSKRRVCELNYTPFVPKPNEEILENPNTETNSEEMNKGKKECTEWEMNLSDTWYKEDFTPLVQGCSCHCCLNHTRAYVHHLLQTKEMLAQVLLMVHNFQEYFLFFHHMREALKQGRYKEFRSRITRNTK